MRESLDNLYSSTRSLRAALRLIRPVNVAIFFFATLLGALLGSSGWSVESLLTRPIVLAAVSIALWAAGANVMNDIVDVEIDRINRPNRPLVTGQVSLGTARLISGSMLAAGLVIPMLISGTHAFVAVLNFLLVSAYNMKLKQLPLLGNVSIGILTSFAILFGSLSVQVSSFVLVAMVFAFMTTLAREIVKDMEDVAGDALAEIQTFPLAAGVVSARNVCIVVVCVTILLTPFPFLFLHFSGFYLLTVVLANATLIRALMLLLEEQIDAGAVSASLKWSMVLGMAALLTAGLPLG